MTHRKNIVSEKFAELLESGANPISDKDKENLEMAYKMAVEAFRDDTLPDGQPFILHNINVAITAIKDIGLGPTSAICALLHTSDAESFIPLAEIRNLFGDTVADILEGFNKLSKLRTERISFQSESFRTLFLSMVDDIRVILIRLAHRLHDIRNIELLGEKKEAFIDEIKYIYTPIAHRLGLYNVKTEFEEKVMQYEHPEIYSEISRKMRETKSKREVYINDFISPVERELMKNGFDVEIKRRTKSISSIWAKMKRQNVDFEDVFDLFAIRIIMNTKAKNEKEECWRAYSIVTNIYSPNPKRLRDWISSPKASGYESLHTTVMGPNERWVEVQIRTRRMDEEAEHGQAAHWAYKGIMQRKNTEDWLTQVRDILHNPVQLNHEQAYKTENGNHKDVIFIFTPKGDLKKLPAGSTVLDFAYEIHTDVGGSCSGATVNNRAVPIRYVLKNGDRVDILTSKKQRPKLDWLGFVSTERARTKIKRQLKEEKYKEAEVGKSLLLRKFKNWKIKSSEDLIDLLVKHFKLDTSIDLFYLIAEEKLEIPEIKRVVLASSEPESGKLKQEEPVQKQVTKNTDEAFEKQDVLYIGDNLKNVDYRFAKCCSPIPGDKVFGFVTTFGGITIHRHACPNAKRLYEQYPYRVITVKWLKQKDSSFALTNLKILGRDELGVVSEISRIITDDLRVHMRSIQFQTKGKSFEGKVTVMIRDNDHLTQLIHKLNSTKGVEKVIRLK